MKSPQQTGARGGSGGKSWLALALTAGAGLALGVSTAWLLGDEAGQVAPAPPPPQDPSPALVLRDDEIRSLREQVEVLGAEKEQLEQELALLRASLIATSSRAPDRAAPTTGAAALKPSAQAKKSVSKAHGLRRRDVNQEPAKPWFDSDALARAGYSDADAQSVRDRWEQFQLDKLYLAGEAKREGYLNKPRHRLQLAELEAELREDLGDYDYDAFLYATGQPNRVVVGDVLQDSPAEEAGFLSGDRVLSYAGDRIFRPRQLRDATSEGVEGSTLDIEVGRGSRIVTLRVSRGPLGIMTKARSDPPQDF